MDTKVSEPLIDRLLLERLERLTLHWQRSFNGLVGGHNLSHFPGAGQEFLDHRSFHQGDDLRSINWRAYLRFEKLLLKMFQVEPRVPVRVLLDCSASMSAPAGSTEPTKFEFARRLAAALVYVGLVRLDSLVLQPFSSQLADPFTASGGRHRFFPAEQFLRQLQSSGRSDFGRAVKLFLNEYRQRGLLVILSDFLDEGCLRSLQYLADFGHELQLVQIWNHNERMPPERGELELEDAETGKVITLAVDEESSAAYTEAFDANAMLVRKVAESNGGRYCGLSTDQPLEEVLFGPVFGRPAPRVSQSAAARFTR